MAESIEWYDEHMSLISEHHATGDKITSVQKPDHAVFIRLNSGPVLACSMMFGSVPNDAPIYLPLMKERRPGEGVTVEELGPVYLSE